MFAKHRQTEWNLDDTFTCSSVWMVTLVGVLEFFHNVFEQDLRQLLMKWTHADHIPAFVSFLISFLLVALMGILFERQQDVLVEEDYLQIGNSPFHYFRADEIRELIFKNGWITIRTHRFRFLSKYFVRKPLRATAHHQLCEWANQQGIVYKIM